MRHKHSMSPYMTGGIIRMEIKLYSSDENKKRSSDILIKLWNILKLASYKMPLFRTLIFGANYKRAWDGFDFN